MGPDVSSRRERRGSVINITTTLTGVAKTENRISAWRLRLPQAVRVQTMRQALRLRTIIVKGIRDGAPGGQEFKPLAESTKKLKKSSKPLIDHGDLLRSIGVDDVGGDQIFVGVNRNVEDIDGNKMYNLAEIHENGTGPYAIPVTPKLSAFWHAMVAKGIFDKPLSSNTKVIMHPGVPARPFLEPSFKEWSKDVERQFSEGLSKALGIGRI